MASLKTMQSYADKCAERLNIESKPVLRWQTPDCKLHSYANAHLIAAATELYEALLTIRTMTPDTIIYDVATTAIAKAEGGK